MTKQNKNCRKQATLGQMVESDSQIVLMREDGTDKPIEEIIESQPGLCDYPFDKPKLSKNSSNVLIHMLRFLFWALNSTL